MALILNIDTAQDIGCVSLAEDDKVITAAINDSQKDHAAWIQYAIDRLFRETDFHITEMAAVGISNGPGSYTGLRIGLSTAKGLCYALNIPLITVGTLEVMAFTAVQSFENPDLKGATSPDMLFCPMVDARRMEVFTAVYDFHLNEVIKPRALILNPHSFQDLLTRQKILFLGNGSRKFEQVCEQADNAIFKNVPLNPSSLASITYRNFIGNNFAGLAYTEPLYLKEFFALKTMESRKP